MAASENDDIFDVLTALEVKEQDQQNERLRMSKASLIGKDWKKGFFQNNQKKVVSKSSKYQHIHFV